MAEISPRICDNRSVGVVITNRYGQYLVFDRATPPVGVAPCAGHVDDHGSSEQAAYAEAYEELGLELTSLILVVDGWRDNVCRRASGPRGDGHHWSVYHATSKTSELAPSRRETRNARWLQRWEIQALYARTLAFVDGEITTEQFEAQPGLESVWALWLTLAGVLDASTVDLERIEAVHRRGYRPRADLSSAKESWTADTGRAYDLRFPWFDRD